MVTEAAPAALLAEHPFEIIMTGSATVASVLGLVLILATSHFIVGGSHEVLGKLYILILTRQQSATHREGKGLEHPFEIIMTGSATVASVLGLVLILATSHFSVGEPRGSRKTIFSNLNETTSATHREGKDLSEIVQDARADIIQTYAKVEDIPLLRERYDGILRSSSYWNQEITSPLDGSACFHV
ncbi:hypothetical protein TCAL_16826 [Tigriopus californicus]|uniref:Uncharacterized protein n=1 Tax=Tigriopus californicus TaxID=6832 RepID=A0A553PA27_TIGCA|nr:hypothetical protein TCAL_16826 [Tigriopus californicus]